jgi:hypothetical protein
MQSVSNRLSMVLLVGYLVMSVAVAGEQEGIMRPCEGPYKGRRPTREEFETLLRNHQAWLEARGGPNDERRANLCQANLAGTSLIAVNLQGASLDAANLQRANLWKANLKATSLIGANLQGATLIEAKLQSVTLYQANLQHANLYKAQLQEAWLEETTLQEAWLVGANLQRASLVEINFAGAVFEPILESSLDIRTLISPHTRLDTLAFHTSPAVLITLREALKKAGMRTHERQLTYAVEHTRMLQTWDPSIIENTWKRRALRDMEKPKDKRPWRERLAGKIESLLSYVLFELPSNYGMTPGRALQTLGVLIGLFALPYMAAVLASGDAGIWMLWLPDRVHKAEGEDKPVRVTPTFFFTSPQKRAAGYWSGGLWRGLSTVFIGLYFSLLSAFSLGWRDLNVGTWIARVQPHEYTLRATGWVRTVSGLQSLLSVYLLALWVLTYFGRPFE